MNYQKIYDSLIERGVNRQKDKRRRQMHAEIGMVERHHIIPKCIGGEDISTNLVFLTPEEHVLAHLLLIRIYPNNQKLIYAANWMTNRVKSNKEYGWVKRQFSKKISDFFIGVPRSESSIIKQKDTMIEKYKNGYISPRVGKSLSDEHKKAISDGNIGKVVQTKSKSSLDGYILRYGEEIGTIKYKEDSAKKDSSSLKSYVKRFGEEIGTEKYTIMVTEMAIRNSGPNAPFFGKTHTPESRQKISENNIGIPKYRSEEHNVKIGNANRGKSQEKVICPHCSISGGRSLMKQWHFDNCKLNPDGPVSIRKQQPMITCPHCGKTGNGPRMKSDHFDKCKKLS
jgi:NUMOD3 motif